MLALNKIHCMDAREGLEKLPDESIDCVVTSPPYWAMRDYRIPATKWGDGMRSVLGLEPTFDAYLEHLLEIFDQIKRVLKNTGTVWVNLGDTYAGSWGSYTPKRTKEKQKQLRYHCSSWPRPAYEDNTFRPPSSYKQFVRPRSLCQIPSRFTIAMANRGWILRDDIVWYKPNHMPSSVKNRFSCSWEHLF